MYLYNCKRRKQVYIDKIYLYDNNSPNGEKFEEVIKDYIDQN